MGSTREQREALAATRRDRAEDRWRKGRARDLHERNMFFMDSSDGNDGADEVNISKVEHALAPTEPFSSLKVSN